MNAIRFRVQMTVGVALSLLVGLAAATTGTGLDESGNRKVHGAMAKNWSKKQGESGQYGNSVNQRQVVNIGNKKSGCSNVNVGTTQPGQRAPKEVVVTTKEVINICK